ncbi:hypothetical protein CDAR_433121 [Caerostris darwini]|uniref:Uncharacterized protein n=1 Tax=Caerostris darwini TaxID=1538125 RepID=A0AAV4QK13_9ARAC|nr:hypothetical protein CDAR_433121 [Caerostris darwini]
MKHLKGREIWDGNKVKVNSAIWKGVGRRGGRELPCVPDSFYTTPISRTIPRIRFPSLAMTEFEIERTVFAPMEL